jgi:hypothetical protein
MENNQTKPNIIVDKSPKKSWQNRLLIFTPTTGIVRMEWVQARYGQVIPTNWSFVELRQFLSGYIPIEYQLADAQNLMAQIVVRDDYEWVLYIEHDNILPDDAFWKINQYINEAKTPVVSGLYWTKTNPPEPILYRGRGNSYYQDWKLGDKVWVDGIPFGFRLEHASLIKAAWKESPEYLVGNNLTRRVFEQPTAMWFDVEKGGMVGKSGTTDLAWCSRCIDDKLFKKAGWDEYQNKEFPYLVDTSIQVGHIDQNGILYPEAAGGIPRRFLKNE